jgi:hypothetical protein
VIGVVLAVCEQLSVAERTQVMAGNARAWYRLRAA